MHRDIKSSNILIDEEFNGKLSDFGLAKLLGAGKSHITTRVMGTFGYVVCLIFFHFVVSCFTNWSMRYYKGNFVVRHMERTIHLFFATVSGMWPLNMPTQVC